MDSERVAPLKAGDLVTYQEPVPNSKYGQFLGIGTVIFIRLFGQRPVAVTFHGCEDGITRRRSFSPKNLTRFNGESS